MQRAAGERQGICRAEDEVQQWMDCQKAPSVFPSVPLSAEKKKMHWCHVQRRYRPGFVHVWGHLRWNQASSLCAHVWGSISNLNALPRQIPPVWLFQTSGSSSLISHTAFTSFVSVRSYIPGFVLLSLQNIVPPRAPGFVLALCLVADLRSAAAFCERCRDTVCLTVLWGACLCYVRGEECRQVAMDSVLQSFTVLCINHCADDLIENHRRWKCLHIHFNSNKLHAFRRQELKQRDCVRRLMCFGHQSM